MPLLLSIGGDMVNKIKTYFNYVIEDDSCIVALDETGVYLFVETDDVMEAEERADAVLQYLDLDEGEASVIAVGSGEATDNAYAFPLEHMESWVRALCEGSTVQLSKEYLESIAQCWELNLNDIKVKRQECVSWLREHWRETVIGKELLELQEVEKFREFLTDEKIADLVADGETATIGLPVDLAGEVKWILREGRGRQSGFSQENLELARKAEWKVLIALGVTMITILVQVIPWWIIALAMVAEFSAICRLDDNLSRQSKPMLKLMLAILVLVNCWNPFVFIVNTILTMIQNFLGLGVF